MNIAVYCASSFGKKEEYTEETKALGKWIGENGHTLVYGGSNVGLMGVIADAVLASNGKVIGVQPNVASIQSCKHYGLTENIECETMADRKSKMIELSDAFIALPGGTGTLDEISEVIALAKLNIVNGPVVLFDIADFYKPLKLFLRDMIDQGFCKEDVLKKVLFSSDLKEITSFIEQKKI